MDLLETGDTTELIKILHQDYYRSLGDVVKAIKEGKETKDGVIADDQFQARQLVRAAFAYIEGVTFVVKLVAFVDCSEHGIQLSDAEFDIVREVQRELDDKGTLVEKPAQIKLVRNLRFAFLLYERAHDLQSQFDASCEWWSKLKSSIRVRDRLMHPRKVEDLEVTPQELTDLLGAVDGFGKLFVKYVNLSKRPLKRVRTKRQKGRS